MKDKTKGSFLHTANAAMSDWHHSTPVGMGIYNFLKKHPFRAIMSIDEVEDKATGATTQDIEYHNSKTVLMSSFVDPITRDLHRMLLEDVVLMEPKDKCICYIAHDHVLLQTESMKRNVLECIDLSRWKPKQLQKTWYFPIEVTMKANPLRETFIADPPHYQEHDIIHMFKPGYGAGVNFTLANQSNLKVKFHHLLDDPTKLMFWRSHNSKRTGRISMVRQLTKLKSQESYGAWAQRWLDECYGDDAQCVQIVHKLNMIEKVAELHAKEELKKQKPISDDSLASYLSLLDNDEMYSAFKDKVDATCREAVTNCYGKFAELTTPIMCFSIALYSQIYNI